jgi:hypothetical protein
MLCYCKPKYGAVMETPMNQLTVGRGILNSDLLGDKL